MHTRCEQNCSHQISNTASGACTNQPATTSALPVGPWPLSHAHHGWDAWPCLPLPASSCPWDLRGSPRSRSRAPLRQCLRAAQAARIHNCPARCGRWPALRTHATRAQRHGGAVGGGRRSRAAACSRRNGPTGHRGSRLGSTRRRPRGVASWRPDRLRGAASELACVKQGIGARLAQHAAGHGRVSEG